MKIVIIDDSTIVLDHMSKLLSCLSLESFCFKNPLIALEQIEQIQPDIIFIDYVMFDMDGISVIKELKKMKNKAKLYLYSAMDEDHIIQLCEQLDVEFVPKPVSFYKINEIVQNFQIDKNEVLV